MKTNIVLSKSYIKKFFNQSINYLFNINLQNNIILMYVNYQRQVKSHLLTQKSCNVNFHIISIAKLEWTLTIKHMPLH